MEKELEIDFESYDIKDYYKDKSYKYDGTHYINTKDSIFRSVKKSLRNPTILLWYLLQWQAWQKKNGISKEWWEKGYIVTHRTMNNIAKDLEVSKATIYRWINQLKQDHYIEKPEQDIFIVGIIDENKFRSYFYEEV